MKRLRLARRLARAAAIDTLRAFVIVRHELARDHARSAEDRWLP